METMIVDYKFCGDKLVPTAQTICDGKTHRNQVLTMGVMVTTDEYECPCYLTPTPKL